MPEIPDVSPGQVAAAEYHNDLRDRTAQRYATAGSRDTENPVPTLGDIAYVESLTQFQVWNGSEWGSVFGGANGSAVVPSFTTSNDTDTGFFRRGSTGWGFSHNGVEVITLGTAGIGAPDGTVAVPSYGFKDNIDTGVYLHQQDTVGITAGGVNGFQLQPTLILLPHVFTDTFGGAANVIVSTGGRMRQATSARRYKSNIEYLT